MNLRNIFSYIPEVKKPEEKKVDFKIKLRWTLTILILFFILANISLFGLTNNALERFEYLAIVLGTDFGSIISLGVGPIVMASIILQLLNGSGFLSIDITTAEGKKFFQGIQKILVLVFIVFESLVYVLMNGLEAAPGFTGIVILQLILGGLVIFLMDEVSSKWGFGSGVSLFIGAGISLRLVTTMFQFIDQQGRNCLLKFSSTACPGKVFVLLQSLVNEAPIEAVTAGLAIGVTAIIFLIVVFAQSLKVEIPLSMGRLRGYQIKWPLSFFYASTIPVILTAALVANVQLFGALIDTTATPCYAVEAACTGGAKIASYFGFLGHFVQGQPVSGFAFWIGSTNILDLAIKGGLSSRYLIQGIAHVLFFTTFSVLFAVLYIKTSGMDTKNVARQIMNSGLQVSGFRQDERVLEAILERYILPLTIMGGIAIGLLASLTDLLGALVSGTAILLVIMIMYQFYQSIAQQHATDMMPALRKFIK